MGEPAEVVLFACNWDGLGVCEMVVGLLFGRSLLLPNGSYVPVASAASPGLAKPSRVQVR